MTTSESENLGGGEEQRGRRLVTMQVPIQLSGPGGLLLDGHTTGINEKGLAARINIVAGTLPSRPEGTVVTITLDLPKERPFDAIEGRILRTEPSWTPGHKYFVALKFVSISTDDIEYLKRFIQWREDRYFRQERPPRSWYLFSKAEHRQYGPLTTSEVLESMRQKAVTNEDLIWSTERGEWIRFSEEAFVEIAAVPRRKSWMALAAGFLVAVLLGGGILGYRDGWLDFSEGARGYREGCRLVREGNLHLAMQRFNDVVRFNEGRSWAALSADALAEAHALLKKEQARQLARDRLDLLRKIPLDKQEHPFVLNNYGDCHYRLDEPEKALDYFLRALEKNPGWKRVHFNVGTTYLRLGNAETALSHFEKAREEMKNRPEFHLNVGLAFLSLGDRAKAMEAFDQAAFLAPEDPEIRTTIARALESGGVS